MKTRVGTTRVGTTGSMLYTMVSWYSTFVYGNVYRQGEEEEEGEGGRGTLLKLSCLHLTLERSAAEH